MRCAPRLIFAAAQDQRINNQTAWRIGLAIIFDAAQARNVILSDEVIRNIIAAAFGIGSEMGLLVETAATGARVSQIANLRVADLQADRPDPRLMMPSSRKGRGQKKVTHVSVPIPASVAEKLSRTSKGKATDAPLLTKPSGERWKQSDHSRLFRRVVRAQCSIPVKLRCMPYGIVRSCAICLPMFLFASSRPNMTLLSP